MSVAFDPGRLGLWIDNPDNFVPRAKSIVNFAGGIFSDVFMNRSSTAAQMDVVRQTVRPDGSKCKAQLYEVPGSLSAADFAARVHADIARLSPGVVELDIEVADAILSQYMRFVVNYFRQPWTDSNGLVHPPRRPTFLFRLNIAPNKAVFLPVDLIQSDPNLYAAEQTYYDDMSRVSEAACILDLLDKGVPRNKAAVCYGAAGPVKLDGTRGITLPSIMADKQILNNRLTSGIVFQDDLMAEVGLI